MAARLADGSDPVVRVIMDPPDAPLTGTTRPCWLIVVHAGGELIIADGELRAIRSERERPDRPGVTGQRMPAPAGRGVPQVDRARAVPGSHHIPPDGLNATQ